MDLSSADAVALTILALSALWGFVRGFVAEALGLLAWSGAVIGAFRLYPLTLPFLTPHLPDWPVAVGVGFAIVFVVLLIGLSLVGRLIGDGLRLVLMGGPDRLLGALFGLVRGYVGLVVIFLVIHMVSHGWLDGLMSGSRLGPPIARGAAWLQGWAGGWIPATITPPSPWHFLPWGHG